MATQSQKLNQLRLDSDFTDYALHSQDGSIYPCHKVVLAAHLDYWKNLLKSGCKESTQGYIELDISNEATELIIKTIYLPDEALDMEPVSIQVYIELLDFAEKTFDESLKNFLNKVSLQELEDKNYSLHALEFASRYTSKNLGDLIFNSIKNDLPDRELSDYIIQNINTDNEIITHGLSRIIGSVFFKHLYENNPQSFMGKNINYYDGMEDILDMESWSREKTEHILDNYDYAISSLIKSLEEKVLSKAEDMKIKSPDQLLSFFSAYCMINISAIGHTVGAIGTDATEREVAYNACRRAGEDGIMEVAEIATSHLLYNILGDKICDLLPLRKDCWITSWKPAWKSATRSIKTTLSKLALSDQKILGMRSWQLAQLFVLAYISQSDVQEKYFQKAYGQSLDALKTKQNFSTSYDEIVKLIAAHTWRKSDELAKNPFIMSIKNILTTIHNKN